MDLEPVPDLQRRRWRPIVIGVAAVVLLTGGAFAYSAIAAARDRSARTARIERGLASAHRCLFGTAPLGAGEDAAARFRAVYLTTRTTAVSPPWPGRCQPALDALAGELRDETAPDRAELARAIGSLRIHLAHLSTMDAAAFQVLARAHASAAAEPDANLPAAPPPLAVRAPPPALPLDTVRTVVASPTRRTIWLASEGARDVCRLGPDGGVACFRPDLQLAHAVRFGAAADGAPLPLIAEHTDDRGARRHAVWLVGRDEPVSQVDAFQAYAWSADAIDMLVRERGQLVLVRQRGERATRTRVTDGAALAILDGEALYWNEHGQLRALVLERDRDRIQPASAADLGAIELALPRATCASQHVHALAFGTHLTLAVDGRWSSPPLALAESPVAITCRERDVVVVSQTAIQICTAATCNPHRPMATPEGDAAHARTGAIDEQPVVLSTGTDPDDRALRVRIAGRDRILFDDTSHGGPDLYPSQVIPIPGAALLVLHAMRGHVSVLRADATGAVSDVMR